MLRHPHHVLHPPGVGHAALLVVICCEGCSGLARCHLRAEIILSECLQGIRESCNFPTWPAADGRDPGPGGVLHPPVCGYLRED